MGIPIRTVPGLVCLKGYEHIGIDDFKRSVEEVIEQRKVEPYLFQFGSYPRIPSDGFYAYELVDLDDLGAPYLEVKDKDDKGLKEFIRKCNNNVFVDAENYVLIVDGEGFTSETITSLPNNDRLFVMFAPYKALRTVPISEAKLYLGLGKAPSERFTKVDFS